MSQKWLNFIMGMVLLGSMASACVRGTGFNPDVYVSPSGSDSNDCWSAATACATVDRALSRLSDLGEVHFSTGEYRLTSSISDLHGLTAVIFRGDGSTTTTLYTPPGGSSLMSFESGLIEIYDLAFDGRDTPHGSPLPSTGILILSGAIVRIQDCLFNGLRAGIENNGGFLYVHDSQFTGNDLAILNRNHASAFTTIDGSDFVGNVRAIIHVLGRMQIDGSTFVDNGLPDPDPRLPPTIDNIDRMSISNSTFRGDVYLAIYNFREGVLEMTNVEISGGEGIGIVNYGQLTADILTITGKPGGGFVNANDPGISNSSATLTHAVISGNGSFGIKNQHYLSIVESVVRGNDGDGILNEYALVTIDHSAIVGNHGRGISAVATTHITDSTISGNDQEGIYFDPLPGSSPLLTLRFVTVADNAGGGFWSSSSAMFVGVTNSIIALNPGGFGDCSGEALWSFDGFNLACDVTDSMTELGLGPLTQVGDTWVHPLLAGSPAVDSAIGVPDPDVFFLLRDQIGTARPQPVGGRFDIGAFELAGPTLSPEIPPVLPPAVILPMFTFTQQANCRQGPDTRYDSLGFGQIGQQAQVEGLSDPAGWYYVQLPDASSRCFVAGSTGVITGPLDGLPVIPSPELPVAPPAPELNVSNQVCDATEYVVRLSWKDGEGEDGYRIYRDGDLIATIAADITFFDDTSPDYGTHAYQVEAFNDYGSAGSSVKASEGCVY